MDWNFVKHCIRMKFYDWFSCMNPKLDKISKPQAAPRRAS